MTDYIEIADSDDRDAWLMARMTGIGASEMAAVLSVSRWASPLSLYLEKTGQIAPDELDEAERIRWGQLLEPVIAEEFSRRTGRHVERAGKLLRSAEHPWAMATLDYWCFVDGNCHPLEIKNGGQFTQDDWEQGAPEPYRIQCHQQMLVTGDRVCSAACLLGGNRLIWCDITRDDILMRKIIHHGRLFWKRVIERDPPRPDAHLATRAALAKLFPKDDGRVVELPALMRELVEEWRAAKDSERKARGVIQRCENEIKATLGEHTTGVFHGGDAISWKRNRAGQRVLRFHPSKLPKGD